MSLSQPLLEPGTDVSRFRVEQLLARGGMGLVYRARDVRLDRPVALKVLAPEVSDDEEFRQRFVRECRLAAALDHPHVVPVYEADDWHGLLYVAMRFVHGADLASVLRGGPLDLPEAMLLITQTASALDAAHDAGLVHRDVKPGNLLVAGARPGHVPEGAHLYLTDFGLTKQAGSLSGLTRSGTFLGSLHYVAPEQIRGEDAGRHARPQDSTSKRRTRSRRTSRSWTRWRCWATWPPGRRGCGSERRAPWGRTRRAPSCARRRPLGSQLRDTGRTLLATGVHGAERSLPTTKPFLRVVTVDAASGPAPPRRP